MLPMPSNFDLVVSRLNVVKLSEINQLESANLSGFVLAMDGTVLLPISLHFHVEGSLWTSNPHSQLACSSTSSIDCEIGFVPKQREMNPVNKERT